MPAGQQSYAGEAQTEVECEAETVGGEDGGEGCCDDGEEG